MEKRSTEKDAVKRVEMEMDKTSEEDEGEGAGGSAGYEGQVEGLFWRTTI
jgi:hypothetical protein